MGAITYFLGRKNRLIMVCYKCGKAKCQDNLRDCPCGGPFEILDEIKWQKKQVRIEAKIRLPKQITVSSRAFKTHMGVVFGQRMDQKPVRLNAAIATACKITAQ